MGSGFYRCCGSALCGTLRGEWVEGLIWFGLIGRDDANGYDLWL